MFRGESVSGDDPVLSAGISLDARHGLFAGASASVAAGKGQPRFNALVQYAGVALRRGEVSGELGLIHRSYDQVVDTGYRRDYFEGFAGVGYHAVRARIYVSPDYLVDGRASYYGEVNARIWSTGKWLLEGHSGLSLLPHDLSSGRHGLRNYQDWRLQLSRPLGAYFVSAAIAATNYPVYSPSGKASVTVSVSRAF